jgi:hypothetical protein
MVPHRGFHNAATNFGLARTLSDTAVVHQDLLLHDDKLCGEHLQADTRIGRNALIIAIGDVCRSSSPARPGGFGWVRSPAMPALLAPVPDDEIEAWPVLSSVGHVRNNGPELLKPMM